MRRTTISNLRQFLLALLLPAVAIATGLQSCNDEGPGIPAEENETAKSFDNPLMRSPEEALDIAQRAYEDFYGDATPSSRGRSIIDCSRPVEVVRGARSRGGNADTLLYIVNFVDDQGFAVIAAPRAADELLAVTSQGHYYPESDSDAESVPGFDMWMENAKAYTNILYDSIRIITPINPDIPGLLQQKEWEDTIQKLIAGPYLNVAWGQGCGLPVNIHYYPEGYYFQNGWAGCSTAAIAQVCAFYQAPDKIAVNPTLGAEDYYLDWSKMIFHKIYAPNTSLSWKCEDSYETHLMIAQFYKILAVWTNASPHGESGTSTLTSNVLPVLRYLLPDKTIYEWKDLKFTNGPAQNELFIMRGKNGISGHMWLCDGWKYRNRIHYFATRPNSNANWEIQSEERILEQFLHYNWGWDGQYNGWFNNAANAIIYHKDGTYSNYEELKYSKIS